jgi:cold shock protein
VHQANPRCCCGHPPAANGDRAVERYDPPVSLGSVEFWRSDQGWGAISAPDRLGLGFVHFSNVRGEGFRELIPGSSVEFEWRDDFEQDGCQWRVAWVQST